MSAPEILRFCLEPGLRESARAGRHNFLGLIADVVRAAGWQIEYAGPEAAARRDAFTLVHMEEPLHDRALCLRRTITYPFWQIERSAARWDWTVARSRFDTAGIDPDTARNFARGWRKRLFGDITPRSGGYVFVPLQGQLGAHRSFQAMSPLAMLESILSHDRRRPVRARLHPKEHYTKEDLTALDALARRYPRLEISNDDAHALLAGCDYVASENSTLGFLGYLLHKPSVLFARIDFHHIAADVRAEGAGPALVRVDGMRPDFDADAWWFLQEMAINAGRDDARLKIAARLRAAGWPL